MSDIKAPLHLSLIVMGPSGCGKTEVGQALANYFGCAFLDGDSYHSAENIAKMKGGTPLTDSDRYSWLEILRGEIEKEFHCSNARNHENVKVVAGCSALRKSYRDILRVVQNSRVIFIFLNCSPTLLERRMRERAGHFMKVEMLTSQLNTLERPEADEQVVTVNLNDNERMDLIVEKVKAGLDILKFE